MEALGICIDARVFYDHPDQVDENGEVVRNTWEDCEEGCPGTDFECNEGFLFNIEGECVNGTQAPGLLSRIGNPCSKLHFFLENG